MPYGGLMAEAVDRRVFHVVVPEGFVFQKTIYFPDEIDPYPVDVYDNGEWLYFVAGRHPSEFYHEDKGSWWTDHAARIYRNQIRKRKDKHA
jgi:hypothetical protein